MLHKQANISSIFRRCGLAAGLYDRYFQNKILILSLTHSPKWPLNRSFKGDFILLSLGNWVMTLLKAQTWWYHNSFLILPFILQVDTMACVVLSSCSETNDVARNELRNLSSQLSHDRIIVTFHRFQSVWFSLHHTTSGTATAALWITVGQMTPL